MKAKLAFRERWAEAHGFTNVVAKKTSTESESKADLSEMELMPESEVQINTTTMLVIQDE